MRTLLLALAGVVLVWGAGSGCSEKPSAPEIAGGAGIRFSLPAGSETLGWVRMELWDVNDITPQQCSRTGEPGRVLLSPSDDPLPDRCTRVEVYIWDYGRNRILFIPDTVAYGGTPGQFPWNGRDDQGNEMPSGYYPTFSRCLDTRGELKFEGHYFNWESREIGSCEWPLWIQEVDPGTSGSVLAYGPFPVVSDTRILDASGIPLKLVSFVNPFLVRVRAPGMTTFEVEVTLEDGKYIDVPITFVPTP